MISYGWGKFKGKRTGSGPVHPLTLAQEAVDFGHSIYRRSCPAFVGNCCVYLFPQYLNEFGAYRKVVNGVADRLTR